MVVFDIYSKSVKCVYKTSICSKATIIILIINLVTFMVPFFLAFKTQGLWLKHANFMEQPDVHFKYEYLIIMETEKIEKPIICTTFPLLEETSEDLNECLFIKAREEDFNRDDLVDRFHFEVQALIDPKLNVFGITAILKFDYKLYSYSKVQMESLSWLEASNPLSGASLKAVADLRLIQKQALPHKGRDLRYNHSLELNDDWDLFEFLKKYSEQNYTTRLENVYTTWSRGKAPDQPFSFSITINIPEETVLYTPGFWQTMKMAWIQYLALLYISILLSRRVKFFILDNRLVHNIKVQPWKKYL